MSETQTTSSEELPLNPTSEQLKDFIKGVTDKAGITDSELAKILGVNKSVLSRAKTQTRTKVVNRLHALAALCPESKKVSGVRAATATVGSVMGALMGVGAVKFLGKRVVLGAIPVVGSAVVAYGVLQALKEIQEANGVKLEVNDDNAELVPDPKQRVAAERE